MSGQAYEPYIEISWVSSAAQYSTNTAFLWKMIQITRLLLNIGPS
jgi:hypothetical protein